MSPPENSQRKINQQILNHTDDNIANKMYLKTVTFFYLDSEKPKEIEPVHIAIWLRR